MELIKTITGKNVVENPWVCLFHGTEEPVKQYQNSVVPILLDEAKREIAKNWLEPEGPNIRDWLLCINEIYNMEGGVGGGLDSEEGETRRHKWSGWPIYKNSWSYLVEVLRCD